MHDWAELKHLCEREGLSKKAAAEKLGMSRTTVHRLLALPEPPVYERKKRSSLLIRIERPSSPLAPSGGVSARQRRPRRDLRLSVCCRWAG